MGTPPTPTSEASPSRAVRRSCRPLLIRADATPAMGVGHAMRCLALAQEAQASGRRVLLSGELSIAWVAELYAGTGIEILPKPALPEDLLTTARRVNAEVVLLDGYHLDESCGHILREGGFRVGAMVDGPFGAQQEADLYIDQNPGSLPRTVAQPAVAIAGADYTLFRDDVLAARASRSQAAFSPGGMKSADSSERARATQPVHVLAVFGGTDPLGAAPDVTPLIVQAAEEAGVDMVLDVVTPDESAVLARLDEFSSSHGPSARCAVNTVPALPNLAERAASADLVVTASGSTVWELLCIGVPTAVVCVIDNQTPGYAFSTEGDYVAGLGHLADLREDETARRNAVGELATALADEGTRLRRSRAGRELLDGAGRRRVLEALLPRAPHA